MLIVSGFISDFQFYNHYTIPVHILPFSLYSILPVFCSYLIILWVFPAWYHMLYLLAPARLCPRYGFQCMFKIQIYRCTCAYLCSPSGFRITTRRGVLTPLDPHVQFWSLERVDSPSCWPEKCSGGVDLQQTVCSPILPGPCASPEFSCCNSWASFVLFILVHPLYFCICAILVM